MSRSAIQLSSVRLSRRAWGAALGALALAACGRDSPLTPEATLLAFVHAMESSRSDLAARRRAFELLSENARASLAERAARASQLSGREMQPWEMLAPGRFTLRGQLRVDPETLTSQIDGDRAIVLVRRGGDRAEVPMIREQGRWRVDLRLPPMNPVRTDVDGGGG